MDGLMVAVDEFTALLAHQPIRPCGGIGVHAAADAVRRFVNTARETGVLQGESCVESRYSRSDDSDLSHGSSPLEAHKRWMNIRHKDALTGLDSCSQAA